MQSRSGDDPEQRPARQWHLNREVSLAHIFSTIAAIGAIAILGNKFDTRVSSLEQTRDEQRTINQRQDKDVDEFKRSVREDYKAIDDKLQRLIERAKP